MAKRGFRLMDSDLQILWGDCARLSPLAA